MSVPRHDREPDPWACIHCGRRFAVPSLVDDHRKTCPMRPEQEDE